VKHARFPIRHTGHITSPLISRAILSSFEDAALALGLSALHNYAEGVVVLLVVPAEINGIS